MCQSGWSSLIVASRNRYVEVVDKLLQHGATVDLLHEVIMLLSIFTLFFLALCILFIHKLCIIYYYYSIL